MSCLHCKHCSGTAAAPVFYEVAAACLGEVYDVDLLSHVGA